MTKQPLIQLRFWLFTLAVIAAFAYPVTRILQFECPRTPPHLYRFELTGYDPNDYFRGKYLHLNPKTATYTREDITTTDLYYSEPEAHNDKMYALLTTDPKTGMAIATVTRQKPADADFLPVKSIHQDWAQISQLREAEEKKQKEAGAKLAANTVPPYHPRFIIELPITKFYVNEEIAKPAQQAINKLTQEHKPVVLIVFIYPHGKYILSDLLFDGIPFHQYLKEHPQK